MQETLLDLDLEPLPLLFETTPPIRLECGCQNTYLKNKNFLFGHNGMVNHAIRMKLHMWVAD